MNGSWTSGWRTFFLASLCAFLAAGCNSLPNSGIDPSGERVFSSPPPPTNVDRSQDQYFDNPLGPLPWDDASVDLTPRETVAPVGSEVVLIAGVCGRDGYLHTNRRLEWSVDPGGVGQFVDVGKTGFVDLMLGDFNMPHKVTNAFAIGSTLRSNTRLNRGTCNPETNAYVLRGQGWITLTSATEGTSTVTVFAPEVYSWDTRVRSATIHWVDAQWQFPTPGIDPAGGRHTFSTTVTHQSNKTPCERWIVRYEILDGPPAGFAPDGGQVAEVPTDPTGQARVEIIEKEPRGGANRIGIQVIRPGDLSGANGQRLVVGSGTTTQTWTVAGQAGAQPCGPTSTSSAALDVRITGPAQTNIGENATFEITVTNRSPTKMANLRIKDSLDPGLEHPAANSRNAIERILNELNPGASQQIRVTVRVSKSGRLCQNVEVTGPSVPTATAQACLVAVGGDTSQAPSAKATITVKMQCPDRQLAVGETAKFTIDITNTGSAPLQNVKIFDRYDRVFQPVMATDGYRQENDGLAWTIDQLSPGRTMQLGVHCTCQSAAGSACNQVQVTASDGTSFSDKACLEIREAATPDNTKPSTPSSQQGNVTPPGGLALSAICLHSPVAVGKQVTYEIRIRNESTDAYRLVGVTATVPDGMTPAPIGTVGPEGIQPQIDGQTVRFEPISELRPGASLVYRVRVQTKQAGKDLRLHVEAIASGLPKPLVQEASTEVF